MPIKDRKGTLVLRSCSLRSYVPLRSVPSGSVSESGIPAPGLNIRFDIPTAFYEATTVLDRPGAAVCWSRAVKERGC